MKFLSIFSIIGLLFISASGERKEGKSIYDPACEAIATGLFAPLDPLYFGLLPTIWFNKPAVDVDFSFVLTNVTFSGLSNVEIINCDVPVILGHTLELQMNFNQLLMTVGDYAVGGHIINLPLNGESYMIGSFQDVEVTLGMETSEFSPNLLSGEPVVCIVPNSTYVKSSIRKPMIYADNLNPGTDQGLLFNTMITTIIPDIFDYIEVLLNPGGKLYGPFDKIVHGAINSIFCNQIDTN